MSARLKFEMVAEVRGKPHPALPSGKLCNGPSNEAAASVVMITSENVTADRKLRQSGSQT